MKEHKGGSRVKNNREGERPVTDAPKRGRAAVKHRPDDQMQSADQRISAMHAAVEEAATLSGNLTGLDLDEAVEVASREVAKIFGADRAVVCFGGGGFPIQGPCLICRNKCLVADRRLLTQAKANGAGDGCPVVSPRVPSPCARLGGAATRVVIPLTIAPVAGLAPGAGGENGGPQRHGFLCLCGVEPVDRAWSDSLLYKARVIREILIAKLTCAVFYAGLCLKSEVDPLTGLKSRRVLVERLREESRRAKRYGHPFSVAIVDVDNMAEVNEKLGHAGGDEVLRKLGRIMREEVRSTDVVARYGGDQFAWLMPETGSDGAVAAVERLEGYVEAMFSAAAAAVTISCGIAEWTGSNVNKGLNMLRRANAAVVEAKCSGRNCVRVAGRGHALVRR